MSCQDILKEQDVSDIQHIYTLSTHVVLCHTIIGIADFLIFFKLSLYGQVSLIKIHNLSIVHTYKLRGYVYIHTYYYRTSRKRSLKTITSFSSLEVVDSHYTENSTHQK